jgi:pimeloyl-ACP methyl ester carboxylesterase
MSEERIHRATTSDGVTIAGQVQGQGPPLVFVHGGLGDGDTGWTAVAPFLRNRFTCYLMSTRGRGASDDHADHSREALVRDVAAFAESIGEPVGLVGHSSGGTLALEAVARTRAVSALALYETTLFDLGPRDAASDQDAFERIGAAVTEGRLVDGVRIFLRDVALGTDDEMAAFEQEGLLGAMAPNLLVAGAEAVQSGPPNLSDLSLLDRITIPVLLLYGSRTPSFYRTVSHAVAARLACPDLREVPAAAHMAPLFAPEPVADELARFFG